MAVADHGGVPELDEMGGLPALAPDVVPGCDH